jgi:hypothetical protein
MSAPDKAALNKSLGILLRRAVMTRAHLNNATALLPVEAELHDGVTSDHISSDMATITTELCLSIDTLRCKYISEGVPAAIIGAVFQSTFESFNYFLSHLQQAVYDQHPPTREHCHAYINANIADSKGVLNTISCMAGFNSNSGD